MPKLFTLCLCSSFLLAACQQETPPLEKTNSTVTNTLSNSATNSIKNNHSKKGSGTITGNTENNTSNAAATAKLFFSEKFEGPNSIEINSFDCHQKIYAVVQLNNYKKGIHKIDIEWTDPFGKTRESTSSRVFISKNQEYSWSSIKLHAAKGANLIAWANPAAGMEEFMGQWSIKLLINEQKIAEENVEVIC